MRKLSLLLTLLAGGFLFSGCVYMDHPVPQISEPSEIGCLDGCGGYDNGHGWNDYVLGTAGPTGYMSDLEEGEYWSSVVRMEKAAPPGCALYEMVSGGIVRVDTYHNSAGDEASGCPPYTYLCGWSGYPLAWSGGNLCPPQPLTDQQQLCNVGNGQCTGPNPAFSGLSGATWYNWPANSLQTTLNWVIVDQTPGTNPFEANMNIRRRPGALCPECGAAAATVQAPEGKVVICHVPPGNPDNAHTIIVGAPAVPAHLAHGDYEGECGGGGPVGEGLQVAAGNGGPDWSLGVGFGADNTRYLLKGQQPWTDDYFSCLYGACGSSQDAANRLLDVLAANPADDKGMVTIGLKKLSGYGESLELNPPLLVKMKMQMVNSQPAFSFAIDVRQANLAPMTQWIINNTPDKKPVEWTGLSIELTSGHVVSGSTIGAALPYQITLNHGRIQRAYDQMTSKNRDLGARVTGR